MSFFKNLGEFLNLGEDANQNPHHKRHKRRSHMCTKRYASPKLRAEVRAAHEANRKAVRYIQRDFKGVPSHLQG